MIFLCVTLGDCLSLFSDIKCVGKLKKKETACFQNAFSIKDQITLLSVPSYKY